MTRQQFVLFIYISRNIEFHETSDTVKTKLLCTFCEKCLVSYRSRLINIFQTFKFTAELRLYIFTTEIMARQKTDFGIRQGLELTRKMIRPLIEIPLHADLQSYVSRHFRKVEEDLYVPVSKTTYDDRAGCLKKLEKSHRFALFVITPIDLGNLKLLKL